METFVNLAPNGWPLDYPWYVSYQITQRCDIALQKLEKVTTDVFPVVDSRRGEMLFLRSFVYFRLEEFFKYIPYVDESVRGTTADSEAISNRDKAKRNDQYLQRHILADLKKAEELLPVTQENKGRITKNAAAAMVTRILMFMAYEQDDRHQIVNINKERLQEALTYLNKLTDQEGGALDLCSDFGTNFVLESDNLIKESAWETQCSINDDGGTGGRINRSEGLDYPWRWGGFRYCDFHHVSYTMGNVFKTGSDGLLMFDTYNNDSYGDYVKGANGGDDKTEISRDNKAYFDKYTFDPRFSHTICASEQPRKYDPNLIFKSQGIGDGTEYGYLKSLKELPNPKYECLLYDGWQFNSMNKRMTRYDEIILQRAEVLIQLDRWDEALPLINKIRTRTTNSTGHLKDASRKYILNYKCETYKPGANCTWGRDFAWKTL